MPRRLLGGLPMVCLSPSLGAAVVVTAIGIGRLTSGRGLRVAITEAQRLI